MIRIHPKTRAIRQSRALLTTNHYPLTTVFAGPKLMKEKNFTFFRQKVQLTRLPSTKHPQNPRRFLSIFVDFCSQNSPISAQNRGQPQVSSSAANSASSAAFA
jgi:hypothetical protein